MSEIEVWKPIDWTDGWYEVSSLGRVRSWRVRFSTTRAAEPAVMSTPISKRGYRVVRIRLGRNGLHNVHRLVCEAFSGPPPEGRNDCRHLDGDALNNLAENLAWGSRLENVADSRRHGTHHHGATHHHARLSDADVLEIRRLCAEGALTQVEIGKRFGVGGPHVCAIAKGRAWRHLLASNAS